MQTYNKVVWPRLEGQGICMCGSVLGAWMGRNRTEGVVGLERVRIDGKEDKAATDLQDHADAH